MLGCKVIAMSTGVREYSVFKKYWAVLSRDTNTRPYGPSDLPRCLDASGQTPSGSHAWAVGRE